MDKLYYATGKWAYEGYLAELRQELSTADGVEFDRVLRAISEAQSYLDLIDWRLKTYDWRRANGRHCKLVNR